jgi:hypothetical protein
MSKRAFLATVVLVWFTTATASMIGNDAAMSEPVLIDPTSRYYGEINNYGGEGYAYDFCYQQNTLGYIVVSREAAARLVRWYAIDDTCTPPVSANTLQSNSGTSSQIFESPVYDSASSRSSKRSKVCNTKDDIMSNGKKCGGRANPRRRS